jgi:sialate O-acetylesterase
LWEDKEKTYNYETLYKAYEEKLFQWQANQKAGKAQGRHPRKPRNDMIGQHRPANLYQGVLSPIIGYGIKGAIWYQGETNAGRGYAYRETFPLMIQSWRQAWGQGDFPFYWVQLADFNKESTEPSDSDWAELRESQTLTLDKLKNLGEAVIIDAGEGRDIHPRNKQIVAKRLLRHALAKDYGHPVPHQSPRYKSVDGSLYSFDTRTPTGFSICGKDQKFVWAEAKIVGKDKVEVWAQSVPSPVAVRYAWADNPSCNLYDKIGAVTLPVTPFRTDNFSLTTIGK